VFFSKEKVWESELLVKEYNTEVANGWGGSLAAISLNQFLNSRHIWPTNCCFSPWNYINTMPFRYATKHQEQCRCRNYWSCCRNYECYV